jgi:hypothetical protein
MTTDTPISKVWSFCHTLRDDSTVSPVANSIQTP